ELLPKIRGEIIESRTQFLLPATIAEIEPNVLRRERDESIVVTGVDGCGKTLPELGRALDLGAGIPGRPLPFGQRSRLRGGIDHLLGRLDHLVGWRIRRTAGGARQQQCEHEEKFHPALRASASAAGSTSCGVAASSAAP